MFKLMVITAISSMRPAMGVSTDVLEYSDMGAANVAYEILKRNKDVHNIHANVTVTVIKLY